MEHILECIIAGGPQHGLVCRRHADTRPLAVVSADGQRCTPAARRQSGDSCTRVILLHPQATGAQFLNALAA